MEEIKQDDVIEEARMNMLVTQAFMLDAPALECVMDHDGGDGVELGKLLEDDLDAAELQCGMGVGLDARITSLQGNVASRTSSPLMAFTSLPTMSSSRGCSNN